MPLCAGRRIDAWLLLLQVSPECIGMGFFFTVSVFVLQLYLGMRGVGLSTRLAL